MWQSHYFPMIISMSTLVFGVSVLLHLVDGHLTNLRFAHVRLSGHLKLVVGVHIGQVPLLVAGKINALSRHSNHTAAALRAHMRQTVRRPVSRRIRKAEANVRNHSAESGRLRLEVLKNWV